MEILHFEDLGGYKGVVNECSLGVNLVINIELYVASDISPLYQICKQNGQLLMEILHFEDLGVTSVVWLRTQLVL